VHVNNDALVAVLGPDTVAAVHGYRLAVIRQAERRGLALVSEPLSGVMQLAGGYVVVDPVDIRLTVRATPDLPPTWRSLRWCPAEGWSVAHGRLDPPARYFTGPDATPGQLVPTAAEVVDWACAQPAGSTEPPIGLELDDDVAAVHRLLRFVDRQHPMSLHRAHHPMPAPAAGEDHEPIGLSNPRSEPREHVRPRC
jgi:hypothetical protein